MKKMILTGLLLITVTGCSSGIQLSIDERIIHPAQPVNLHVDRIQVVNNAKINTKRTRGFAVDLENPLPKQVQVQFHKYTVKLLENFVLPDQKSNNIAILRLDEIFVTQTSLSMPFVDLVLLAAGRKENYTATIKGVIEIENSQRQVLRSISFDVTGTVQDKTGVIEEINRGAKRASEKALQLLEQEIRNKVHRYLYD